MSSKKKRDYRSQKNTDGFRRIKDPSTKKKREKLQATDWN